VSRDDRRAEVRAYFDRNVAEWDTVRYLDQTYVGRARHALRWLRSLGRGRRVLDLGCGTGRQTVAGTRAGLCVVSADFSFEMARATRQRVLRECPGAAPAVVVADALHPPFRPGAFDAVMALGVVGFVPDRPGMLREARTLLAPGGELVCDVGVPERRVLFPALGAALDRPLRSLARLWRERILRRPKTEGDDSGAPGWYGRHFVKHAPEEIEAMLCEAGFRPLARGGSGLGELRLLGRLVLPWRVQGALTRLAVVLSALPGGGWLARRSLTYVVRSARAPDLPARVPERAPVPPPVAALADAPALRRQLL
jgi:ubiquinone/menaquinone biosynthesis C-methylase UbiE